MTTVRMTKPAAGTVFAVVWALANLFHLTIASHGRPDAISSASLVGSLWLLAAPQSAGRLFLAAALQVAAATWHLPSTPDHQVLAAFVNTLIIASWLRRRQPDTDSLVKAIAPGARLTFLVAYCAAAISKYNDTFIDPVRSCASWIAATASGGLIDRGDPAAAGFVFSTLLAETSIPVLLLVSRTRRWGAVIGICFHLLVCLSPAIGVGDFSATLWALFLLFAHPSDVSEVGDTVRAKLRRNRFVKDLIRLPRTPLVLAIAALIVVAARTDDGSLVMIVVGWMVTITTGLALVVALAHNTWRNSRPPAQLGPVRLSQVLVALVLFAMVASPYLGFGTSSRFTMFSGLRTEGPGTNHLFLPSIHLIDSQNHWLIIDKLTSLDAPAGRPSNASPATAHAAIPEVELRNLLTDKHRGGTFITQGGQKVVVTPGKDHPLRGGTPWWEAHTQNYRPFVADGISDPGFCSN